MCGSVVFSGLRHAFITVHSETFLSPPSEESTPISHHSRFFSSISPAPFLFMLLDMTATNGHCYAFRAQIRSCLTFLVDDIVLLAFFCGGLFSSSMFQDLSTWFYLSVISFVLLLTDILSHRYLCLGNIGDSFTPFLWWIALHYCRHLCADFPMAIHFLFLLDVHLGVELTVGGTLRLFQVTAVLYIATSNVHGFPSASPILTMIYLSGYSSVTDS